MRTDQGDFILSEDELSAVLNTAEGTPNALGLAAGPVEGSKGAGEILASLDPSLRTALERAIAALISPVKVARFHYTVADESISRSFLAWSAGTDDELIALVKTGENRRISARSQSSMRLLISRLLAANDTLVEEGISLLLSSGAILVFLAIAEHLRMVRYHAIQTHAAPSNFFNQAEVEARLAEAAIEDFRWPLLFLDKVMPAPIAGALTPQDVRVAIDELMLAGLVDQVDESGELQVFELAGPGVRICDALLHEVGKVALGMSAFRDDGEIGHEVMLLVRSGFDLFLFDFAGQQGAIASLGANGLDELLKHAMRPASVQPSGAAGTVEVAQQAATQSATPSSIRCATCGLALPDGARFCSQCGTAVAAAPSPAAGRRATKACPACGHANRASSEFCVQCGTQLPAS